MSEFKTKPIKVVRIFSRLNIGGPSLQVVLLSRELSFKYDTLLITGKVGNEEGDMSYLLKTDEPYRYLFISELGRDIHFFKDMIAFWKLWRLLQIERPKIIHTHTSKAGFLGRIAAIFSGVPIRVHTYHGHVFENYYGGLKTFFIKLTEKILGYFTTHVIAISPKQKEALTSKFQVVSEHKVSIVPLGFDLSEFKETTLSKEEIKERLHIPFQHYYIGIIGRLVPIKNHQLFLRIAAKLLKVRKDVHFLIVGEGPCRDSLYKAAEKLGILSNLSFLGWQEKLKPIYHILDIVLLTSLNEGTPVSLIEAQACGVPVIATHVGGMQDVVFPNKNGYLLSPDDEDGFVEKIGILLNDSDLRKNMSEFGKNYMFSHFEKGRLLSDIDHLYSRLLRERVHP